MENKIQELTDRIYREGVEKGNEEAQKIIARSQEEAKKIVDDAQRKAEMLIAAARKSANDLEDNTKSELKLFADQAVNALKSEIASLITDKVVVNSVDNFIKDKNYFNAFVVSLATDAEELKKYFGVKAKNLLDEGVEIKQVNGIKTLFSISPADGSYKVNFGEEEFMNYFKEFLRPQIVEMLF